MESKRYSKRKWLIYTASCLVSMMDFAVVLTFGSVFVHLLDRFGENRTTTATIQSILLGTATSSSVVSGILVKKFGPARVSLFGSAFLSGGFLFSFFAKSILLLDVFIGVFAGIGVSLLYVSSTVVARNSFDGQARDIAVGVYNVFVGIGATIYPYALSTLADNQTVDGTFLILGGVFLNNFVISLLFFTSEKFSKQSLVNSQKDAASLEIAECETEDTDKNTTTGNRFYIVLAILWKRMVALMHLRYTLVLLGTGFLTASINSYLIVFNDIYEWKGFTKGESLLFLTVLHAFSTAARASPPVYSKVKPGSDIMLLLAVFAICGCMGQLLVLFSTRVGLVLTGNAFTGLTLGGVLSAAIVAVAKYSSKELFGVAFGLMLTLIGVMTLVFGPIYGYIRDSIQSYEVAIVLTATLSGIGAMLFSAAPIYEIYWTKIQRELSVEAQTSPPDTIISLPFNCRHNAHKTVSIDSTYM